MLHKKLLLLQSPPQGTRRAEKETLAASPTTALEVDGGHVCLGKATPHPAQCSFWNTPGHGALATLQQEGQVRPLGQGRRSQPVSWSQSRNTQLQAGGLFLSCSPLSRAAWFMGF